jgi:hypothetical protein
MKFPYETKNGFTILDAKSAQYSCPDKSHITCVITVKGGVFGEAEVEIPFTAGDGEEGHGGELFKHFKTKAKKYAKPAAVSLFELQAEFDELMIDITLGLASDEEKARAAELRTQIKGMR